MLEIQRGLYKRVQDNDMMRLHSIVGLVYDSGNSIANALELPTSCTKRSL